MLFEATFCVSVKCGVALHERYRNRKHVFCFENSRDLDLVRTALLDFANETFHRIGKDARGAEPSQRCFKEKAPNPSLPRVSC